MVSLSDGGYALDTSSSERDGVAEAFVAPDPGDEAKVLQSLGFSRPLIRLLAAKARDNGTTVETELLHHSGIDESACYGAMARLLRLPFLERVADNALIDSANLDTQPCRPLTVRVHHRQAAPQVAIMPEAGRAGATCCRADQPAVAEARPGESPPRPLFAALYGVAVPGVGCGKRVACC
ncbi:hypothetical protein ABID21_004773 [Pseudorhizobium tarimense]|uniref:Uncharacterized protein n=1 Tax=Pseudorhizobium tarimense TaxID=1079109 RepID=A0ABV2HEK1_9HYPH|nr:hypothetical protein [Pseudorhizobium tarimense]MCJ8521657.1 hypothetical protein [Pseudorhizobium tarimense]